MTLYPTFTAFDDALEMLEQAVKANEGAFDSDELKLVHAICHMPSGHAYSHAWVESNETHVWFMGIVDGVRQQFCADRMEFYDYYRVQIMTKYTPREAWEKNKAHCNYGPWEEKYIALCRQPGEPRHVEALRI